MKRNTDTLPKFKGLAKELGMARYVTMGVLEAIWDLTGKHAPRGNIGKFSNQEIADDLGWEGNADELIAALVKHRWIDTSSKYRLVIHDWKDHAPDWLKKAVARSGQGWASDDDSSVCPPVAAVGSQCQPVASSGVLPNLPTSNQTITSQTSPTPSEEMRDGVCARVEAGRQVDTRTVREWCHDNRITGKMRTMVVGTAGATVSALEAERRLAETDKSVKNAAATAIYRVCDALGNTPPPAKAIGDSAKIDFVAAIEKIKYNRMRRGNHDGAEA